MTERVLSTGQLRGYLKNIKDLEVLCYQQRELLRRLRERPAEIRQQLSALEASAKEEVDAPTPVVISMLIGLGMGLFYGVIYGAFGGAVLGLMVWVCQIIIPMHLKFLTAIKWGAIIGFGVVAAYLLICSVIGGRKEKKSYPGRLTVFQKKQQDNEARISVLRREMAVQLPKLLQESEKKYAQTQQLLQSYYNLDIIYPSYRGIVPISTMCQYLDSGRCTQLSGHEGAYNLYENELRMNLIIGKLDTIIQQLDEISSSQRALAQELRQSNERIDQIFRSIQTLQESSEWTRYYSGITAANTTYLAFLRYLGQ